MRTRCTASHRIFCVLFSSHAAALALADWTHQGRDATRNSIASSGPGDYSNLRAAAAPEADEEFVGRASPLFANGVVYLTARQFDQGLHVANELIAIDAADGQRLWTAALIPDVHDSWSAPALDLRNENVLVASDERLYAIRVSDGSERWHVDLQRPVVNASPAISDDLVNGGVPANRAFITDFNGLGPATLYAINVDPFDAVANPFLPGQIAWSAPLPAGSGNSPAYAEGVVFVATPAGTLHAFAGLDGQPLWSTPVSPAFGGFFGGVTARDGFVYAASYDFNGTGDNSGLFKLDAVTGAIVWSVASERTDSIPIIAGDGRIYLSAGIDGFGSAVKIQAFDDLGTSAVLAWDTYVDTGGVLEIGGWTSQPALVGRRLFCGQPASADSDGPYASAMLLDVAHDPTDMEFVIDSHDGSGGSAALADGCVASVGEDGLFIFCPCTGDVNGDGLVDLADLSRLLTAFGASQGSPDYDPAADFNADGVVDLTDLSTLLVVFGTECS